MFKTNFYIATLTAKRCIEYQQKNRLGRTFRSPGRLGVALRFDRRMPNAWRITEEHTGYAANGDYYSTRAEAVRSLTPEFLQKIADRVKCPEMLLAAETLAAFILAQKSPIDKATTGQYNKTKE